MITVANQLNNATTHQRNQFEALAHSMRSAMGHNKEIATHVTRAQEDLSPLFVIELFKRISDEDCELLWLEVSRPPWCHHEEVARGHTVAPWA